MRLKVTNSKNNTHYSIIYDYTTLSGKRTTRVFENLGNMLQLEERFGKVDTLAKVNEYVEKLKKESKEEIIKKE